MSHQSSAAVTHEFTPEAQAGEAQVIEEATDIATINNTFDEEPREELQAPRENLHIGRVVSVAGSQVMLLLENRGAEGVPKPPIVTR